MRVVETPAKEGSSVSQPCPILGLMSSPTIAPWSADQVTALAPDKQVATAGLKLASPATWSDAGVHEALPHTSASGSGKKPYRVCVDLSGPAFTCSCPSRKFPCKHAVGLLHLWSRGQVADRGTGRLRRRVAGGPGQASPADGRAAGGRGPAR